MKIPPRVKALLNEGWTLVTSGHEREDVIRTFNMQYGERIKFYERKIVIEFRSTVYRFKARPGTVFYIYYLFCRLKSGRKIRKVKKIKKLRIGARGPWL